MSSSTDDAAPDLLEIGRIERAHGLRGEVVVGFVTNLIAERTAPGAALVAGDRPVVVRAARPHGNRWLVSFEGVDGRDGADALRGRTLLAPPLDRPAGAAGAGPVGDRDPAMAHGTQVVAFVHELIGRRVVDQHGRDHGPVVAVVENPAADLLELADGGLVPLTFYRSNDGEVISVEVPDGLLDDWVEVVPTEPDR